MDFCTAPKEPSGVGRSGKEEWTKGGGGGGEGEEGQSQENIKVKYRKRYSDLWRIAGVCVASPEEAWGVLHVCVCVCLV